MHLHVHAQLSADDYGNAQILHMGSRRKFILFLFLALSMLAVISIFTSAHYDSSNFFAVLFAIAISFSIAWWSVYHSIPKRMRKNAAKLFQQQISLQKPREIELTDKVFIARSEQGEGKQPWNEFHKWKFNEAIIVVYSSDVLMNMFPRRWFATDADYQNLKDTLAREIAEPGKPRKRI